LVQFFKTPPLADENIEEANLFASVLRIGELRKGIEK
jgi:hypothetical protein